MAKHEKICAYCGKAFEAQHGRKKYCNEKCCYKANAPGRKERQEQYYRERREKREKLMRFIQGKETIAGIDEEARQAGMTYGQYVAWQQSQKEIAERQAERAQGIRFFDRYIKSLQEVETCQQQ